ncbi:hypothetical protein BD779DRAFT_1167587 [Infundibulicybe gibba]|nr:hypothetical protein BD779DRAFT_1167587 [Infundibulicybe gibba]
MKNAFLMHLFGYGAQTTSTTDRPVAGPAGHTSSFILPIGLLESCAAMLELFAPWKTEISVLSNPLQTHYMSTRNWVQRKMIRDGISHLPRCRYTRFHRNSLRRASESPRHRLYYRISRPMLKMARRSLSLMPAAVRPRGYLIYQDQIHWCRD